MNNPTACVQLTQAGSDLQTERARFELIIPPSIQRQSLDDPGVKVIVTEGRSNMLAVDRVMGFGASNRDPNRCVTIGLPVGWRDDGPFIEQIPELLQIASRGFAKPREVILAFDRDAESSRQIEALAKMLRDRHVTVAIFAWPTKPADAVTIAELTDLGEDQFRRLIEALSNTGIVNTKLLAEALTVCDQFAKDAGGLLYLYQDGVYNRDGESYVKRRIKQLMGAWGNQAEWFSALAPEVIEFIRVDAPELWQTLPGDVMNVANGLLNTRTRTLERHSPNFLSSVQLPVSFDAEAKCPSWDWFVEAVFPADAQPIAWEIPAWLMKPKTPLQKAILLLGEGANGKSTYLAGIVTFLGRQNCTAISLQKLESDRFAAARLVGKLANICPDLPSSHLTGTSVFKALTGGDTVGAERKYRDSFEFLPFAKLIFSANQPPHSDDSTHGFFRRWLVVQFTRVFEEGAANTLSREDLDELLSSPNELSGLLNHALDALARLEDEGFTQSESMVRAWDEFRRETDPLSVWLDRCTIDDPAAFVPVKNLLHAYNAECDARRRPPMTSTGFGLALKRLRKVAVQQKTVGGQVVRCYTGIGIQPRPGPIFPSRG
jgi:P4 family phage/plasmid primase-like protien